MEFAILILAIVLFIPAVYAILIATLLINVVFTLAVNGPRKGVEKIKSWNAPH